MKKKLIAFLFLSIATLQAKVRPNADSDTWHLQSFLYMVEKYPERLISLGENLFSDERLELSRKSPALAGEWRHRSAILSSLSQFFAPGKSEEGIPYKERATAIIKKALLEDPALLVRDAAVESIGRMNRMQPGITRYWRKSLESAFVDQKNIVQGEGLFIRESILRLLKESGMRPTRKIRRAAKRDQNQAVRYMLNDWKTETFQSISR